MMMVKRSVDPRLCVAVYTLRFLADYDEQFPLADDISLLQQVSPHLYPLCYFSI